MADIKTILLVEDDPDDRASISLMIKSGGYRVVTAGSEAEGIEAFLRERPSLVLCDIMMERIDAGFRLLKRIREQDSSVPIYLLSNVARIAVSRIDLSAIQCDGYIQKPVDPDNLLAIIREAIGESRP